MIEATCQAIYKSSDIRGRGKSKVLMLVSLGVPDNKGPIRGVVRSLVNQVVPVSIIPSNIGNLGGLVENYPTMVGILSSLIGLPSK